MRWQEDFASGLSFSMDGLSGHSVHPLGDSAGGLMLTLGSSLRSTVRIWGRPLRTKALLLSHLLRSQQTPSSRSPLAWAEPGPQSGTQEPDAGWSWSCSLLGAANVGATSQGLLRAEM